MASCGCNVNDELRPTYTRQTESTKPANIIEIKSEKQFESIIDDPKLGKVVIVDMYTPWCGPCQRLGPELAKLASLPGFANHLLVLKVNADEQKNIAINHEVSHYPSIYVYNKMSSKSNRKGKSSYVQIDHTIQNITKTVKNIIEKSSKAPGRTRRRLSSKNDGDSDSENSD